MSLIEKTGLAFLKRLDPERAHTLAITGLKTGLAPLPQPFRSPRLKTSIGPLDMANPIGLAAGFDKNAEALGPLLSAGFGFIECGAVTPRPQPGNPKPRLFRLTQDRAVINRFGFNNEGAEAIAARLAKRPKRGTLGLNLGANKDSEDRAADFGRVLTICGPHIDFATINVSSPNTEKLRDLQGADALRDVLNRTQDANAKLARPVPLLLKIAPDLTEGDLDTIARAAAEAGLTAIIATNTTLSREGLQSADRDQAGGLSGAPLFDLSTRILRQLARRTDLPLIGVGGIETPEQAYAKIRAGASAIQLYSALSYQGLGLVPKLARGVDALLARDGFATLGDAVGADLR